MPATSAGMTMKTRRVQAPLLDLGRDFLQDLDETLAVAFADHLIQVAFVPARAARHDGENFFPAGVMFRQ